MAAVASEAGGRVEYVLLGPQSQKLLGLIHGALLVTHFSVGPDETGAGAVGGSMPNALSLRIDIFKVNGTMNDCAVFDTTESEAAPEGLRVMYGVPVGRPGTS